MNKVLVMVGVVAALTAATVGVASAQGPNLCVSVNGEDRVELGTATCSSVESDGAANVARATGDDAFAVAVYRVPSSQPARPTVMLRIGPW